mmetsp:Transcript_24575/g.47088  ORF Transcript_24575/g.47088 Transcript_24575/m.47088 type:complete len:320 (+) Transcript_24575:1025-1984(+)
MSTLQVAIFFILGVTKTGKAPMTMWVPFFSFSSLFNDPSLLNTHVPRTTFKQALQATARKMSYYNGYVLWAGGQPDFQYAASGDSSDYMYAALGVASFGLELGEDFYENCNLFERKVLPDNISALTYLAKNAKKPFSLPKGPDIISLDLSDDGTTQDGVQYGIKVTTVASDSRLVNSISGYPDFTETGSQGVSEVRVYLDVHPDDFKEGDDLTWEMQLIDNDSEEPKFELEVISAEGFSSGRHTLYVQAKDRDGYFGPATGAFFDVEIRPTKSPSLAPTTDSPSLKPTSTPTRRPSKKAVCISNDCHAISLAHRKTKHL